MTTQVIRDLEVLIATLTSEVTDEDTLALVPTLGNLHEGHMVLVSAAKAKANKVAVSIFVNPSQFGPTEDFNSYPRTLDADIEKCREAGVDYIFAPDAEAMYPFGQEHNVWLIEDDLSLGLCGAKRPGHFKGVLTVVMKLINLIQPDYAVFGEKDYQQLALIHKMVRDLFMPVDLLAVQIVREEDGLAMSSRNQYLTQEERNIAPKLYDVLQEAALLLKNESPEAVKAESILQLQNAGFTVDYFEICDPENLKPLKLIEGDAVILAAVFLGKTRLIDNLRCEFNEDLP